MFEAKDGGGDSPVRAPRAARLGLAGPWPWVGAFGSLLIAVTAPLWYLSGRLWRLTLPGIPHDGRRPFTLITFLIGAVLLGAAWIGLLSRLHRSRASQRDQFRAVIAAAALWFAPVLIGPPLLSSDIYSYAAQGQMVTQGLDPTSEGMYRLHSGFLAHVDPVWRNSPGNPYGPVQMGVAAGVVTATDHDYERTVWGLRLVALGGVILAGWGVVELARRSGTPPPLALAGAIANPVVVLHIVGGGHNEGLLLGLLLAGGALAARSRWGWATVLLAGAAAVKLTAAAPLVFLAFCRPGARAALRERIRSMARTGAAALGIVAGASLLVGVGFGWIAAMRNAGQTKGTLSLTTQVGFTISDTLATLGVPAAADTWVDLARAAGMAAAAAICLYLLHVCFTGRPASLADGPPWVAAVRAGALSMLAVIFLGPVVWPWYLAPSVALLFAVGVGRWLPSLVVTTAFFAAVVLPNGDSGKPVLEGQHVANLVLIAVVAGAALLAPRAAELWESVKRRAAVGEVAEPAVS